jgi:hypothetical protein
MATYKIPETANERISDFDRLILEFKHDYKLFIEKQKKVSGHRARKSLLSLSKLTRFIRKDIYDILQAMPKTEKTK